MANKLDYEDLVRRLAEAEEIIEALRNQEVDAVVGKKSVLMLRLKKTEDQLKNQRSNLEKLVRERDELIQDLKVHQVELEVQGEELHQAQQAAEESRDKYLELYDHAPVGYLTLGKDGAILEANLSAASILGFERSQLIRSRFTRLISPDSQDAFYFYWKKVLANSHKKTCEIRLHKSDGAPFYAQLDTISVYSNQQLDHIRMTLTDITERRQAQEALARAKDELEIKVQERTEQLQEAYDEILQSQKSLKETNKQLKQYAYKITQVQEEERRRIAYELHDDTAQYLSILKMQIGSLAESKEIRNPRVKEKLQYLEKDADRAFNDVRRYSHELRPVVLEYQGLAAALDQIAEDFNKLGQFSVNVHVEGMQPKLSEEVKLGFFRIAQEALNNTRKHSNASQAKIDIRFDHKQIRMTVSDNGKGFDTKTALKKSGGQGSLGLTSMRERADLIGASLKMESIPGKGTTIQVELQLKV